MISRTLLRLSALALVCCSSSPRIAAQGEPKKIDPVRRAAIQSILIEVQEFAPMKSSHREALGAIQVDDLPASDRDLARYKDDAFNPFALKPAAFRAVAKKFPVRAKVAEIANKLTEYSALPLSEVLLGAEGPPTLTEKKKFLEPIKDPVLAMLDLEEALEDIRKLLDDRDKETPRWQAHYDLALARLLSRLVYLYEYRNLLALLRSDNLPEAVDDKIHVGWIVEASPKVQIKEAAIKAMAKDANKLWARILAEHPGTPWAVIAERERDRPMGLRWAPLVRGAAKE